MKAETAKTLSHKLSQPGAPDIDESMIPALVTIPEPDAWTRGSDRRVFILASNLLYVVSVKEQQVRIEMFPASPDEVVAIGVTFALGDLLPGGSHLRERTWSFDFGEGRSIQVTGREVPGAEPAQDEEEIFARKLATRLGWTDLPIIEGGES